MTPGRPGVWQGGRVARHDPEDEPTAAPAGAGRRMPGALLAAVVVAWVEALAIVGYTVGIVVSGAREPGSVAATPVLAVIYLAFAAGIAVCGRALAQRRRAARTPFGVIQLFGLVVGWTLTQGDGDLTHRVGYAVLAVSVLGIALVVSPALGEELDR